MKKLVAVLAIISFNVHAAPDCRELPSCESLGYICSAEDCDELKTLSCPFDLSKKVCFPKEKDCEVGDILYDDFKCRNSSCGHTPIAVIYDTENRLAISMSDLSKLQWCTVDNVFDYDIPELENCTAHQSPIKGCGVDGKKNTQIIIDFGKANNVSYPAAEYCYNLTWGDVPVGTWWLPSMEELYNIFNIYKTTPALENVLKKYNIFRDYVIPVSSTEYNYQFVYNFQSHNTALTMYYNKTGYYDVRCLINY